MLDGTGQAGVLITDKMVAAGFAAAREHFFDDSDASIVTPEALREIFSAMVRSSDAGAPAGKLPSLT